MGLPARLTRSTMFESVNADVCVIYVNWDPPGWMCPGLSGMYEFRHFRPRQSPMVAGRGIQSSVHKARGETGINFFDTANVFSGGDRRSRAGRLRGEGRWSARG
jgi:hypothetical protein